MKLGKHSPAPHPHPHTLRLANYLTGEPLPPAPPVVNWSAAVNRWGMLANDQLGDCVIASAAHMEQAWAANAGGDFVPADPQVIADYSAITGYTPGNPASDQGTVLTSALAYWRDHGLCGNRKILGWASVNPKNEAEMRTALFLFGGLFCGLALPKTAQAQVGFTWDLVTNDPVNAAPYSWGGHGVPFMEADDGLCQCVTWGSVQKMTWAFATSYADEVFAIISPNWIRQATEQAPSGLDLAQLQADIAALT